MINYPTLYGWQITNTGEFKDALMAASADLANGRISLEEARAIHRESRKILKNIRALIPLRKAEAAR